VEIGYSIGLISEEAFLTDHNTTKGAAATRRTATGLTGGLVLAQLSAGCNGGGRPADERLENAFRDTCEILAGCYGDPGYQAYCNDGVDDYLSDIRAVRDLQGAEACFRRYAAYIDCYYGQGCDALAAEQAFLNCQEEGRRAEAACEDLLEDDVDEDEEPPPLPPPR